MFDTISLLIQSSLEGELKLMDELAGPEGQPSAFPPASSPGGSDPQVTVPALCLLPCPASCAVLCLLLGRWGVPCALGPWRRSGPGPPLSFGLGRRHPGVPP